MLRVMGVRFLVVPCVSTLLQMWTQRFGFTPVSTAERDALEDQIVLMDPETTFLVKKAINNKKGEHPECEQEKQNTSAEAAALIHHARAHAEPPADDTLAAERDPPLLVTRKRKSSKVGEQEGQTTPKRLQRAAAKKAKRALAVIPEDDEFQPSGPGDHEDDDSDTFLANSGSKRQSKMVKPGTKCLDKLAAKQAKGPQRQPLTLLNPGERMGRKANEETKYSLPRLDPKTDSYRRLYKRWKQKLDAVEKHTTPKLAAKLVTEEVLQYQLESERREHAATQAKLLDTKNENTKLRQAMDSLLLQNSNNKEQIASMPSDAALLQPPPPAAALCPTDGGFKNLSSAARNSRGELPCPGSFTSAPLHEAKPSLPGDATEGHLLCSPPQSALLLRDQAVCCDPPQQPHPALPPAASEFMLKDGEAQAASKAFTGLRSYLGSAYGLVISSPPADGIVQLTPQQEAKPSVYIAADTPEGGHDSFKEAVKRSVANPGASGVKSAGRLGQYQQLGSFCAQQNSMEQNLCRPNGKRAAPSRKLGKSGGERAALLAPSQPPSWTPVLSIPAPSREKAADQTQTHQHLQIPPRKRASAKLMPQACRSLSQHDLSIPKKTDTLLQPAGESTSSSRPVTVAVQLADSAEQCSLRSAFAAVFGVRTLNLPNKVSETEPLGIRRNIYPMVQIAPPSFSTCSQSLGSANGHLTAVEPICKEANEGSQADLNQDFFTGERAEVELEKAADSHVPAQLVARNSSSSACFCSASKCQKSSYSDTFIEPTSSNDVPEELPSLNAQEVAVPPLQGDGALHQNTSATYDNASRSLPGHRLQTSMPKAVKLSRDKFSPEEQPEKHAASSTAKAEAPCSIPEDCTTVTKQTISLVAQIFDASLLCSPASDSNDGSQMQESRTPPILTGPVLLSQTAPSSPCPPPCALAARSCVDGEKSLCTPGGVSPRHKVRLLGKLNTSRRINYVCKHSSLGKGTAWPIPNSGTAAARHFKEGIQQRDNGALEASGNILHPVEQLSGAVAPAKASQQNKQNAGEGQLPETGSPEIETGSPETLNIEREGQAMEDFRAESASKPAACNDSLAHDETHNGSCKVANDEHPDALEYPATLEPMRPEEPDAAAAMDLAGQFAWLK